ncbi:hypothetical protein MAV_4229 [Mycobacterium avium 104]|uniref:Uncharacterized protein n=1 Tax=Mycobacterium avium (strain 104) TaxID=243243 RepID=A0A0H3A3I2_MYCA1|nr:hypothetical protein MAV_4229 [Mycobacterium avium 104]
MAAGAGRHAGVTPESEREDESEREPQTSEE